MNEELRSPARAPSRGRWRPLLRLAIVAAAWSCASASMPPGGPEDDVSPAVERLRPDTNAVNVRAGGDVTFDFDKVVSERPQGAPDLNGIFLISPSYGVTRLSWRRNSISIHPSGGFKPATTYTVRMLPGLTDLQGNVDTVGRTLVFSTGPTIADGSDPRHHLRLAGREARSQGDHRGVPAPDAQGLRALHRDCRLGRAFRRRAPSRRSLPAARFDRPEQEPIPRSARALRHDDRGARR